MLKIKICESENSFIVSQQVAAPGIPPPFTQNFRRLAAVHDRRARAERSFSETRRPLRTAHLLIREDVRGKKKKSYRALVPSPCIAPWLAAARPGPVRSTKKKRIATLSATASYIRCLWNIRRRQVIFGVSGRVFVLHVSKKFSV